MTSVESITKLYGAEGVQRQVGSKSKKPTMRERWDRCLVGILGWCNCRISNEWGNKMLEERYGRTRMKRESGCEDDEGRRRMMMMMVMWMGMGVWWEQVGRGGRRIRNSSSSSSSSRKSRTGVTAASTQSTQGAQRPLNP